jgi:hypothetical protein
MRFFIDSKARTVTAYNTLGEASRAVLIELGEEIERGQDPVKLVLEKLADRGVIFNISQALQAIADSDDQAAQELAYQMKQAVDKLYRNK